MHVGLWSDILRGVLISTDSALTRSKLRQAYISTSSFYGTDFIVVHPLRRFPFGNLKFILVSSPIVHTYVPGFYF